MRFGIIGPGEITEKFVRNASFNPGFEAAAILSRSRERGEAFAARCGIPTTYTTLDEMAGDASLDAVYVASPNSLHMEQSVRMSEAGKHVFCEKAVASNVRELEAMIAAAKRSGTAFLEAMRPAFNPNLPVLEAKLKELGQPRNALLSVCKYSSRYDAFRAGDVRNAFDPSLSNGAVMDMGSYATFLLVALFGEPKRLHAADVKLENGFDGFGAYLAVYPGMVAEVLYSKVSRALAGSEIQFDDASVRIGNLPGVGGIEIRYRDGRVEKLADPDVPEYMLETAAFLRCCEDPSLAEPHHAESLAVMRVLDEVRRQNGIAFPADRA